MTPIQLRLFPTFFAEKLAAPGCDKQLYSLLETIEKQGAFDVFEALDELNKPNGNHSAAIQILKSNIDNESLREIGSYAKLELRKILRLHIPDFYANLSDEEKRDLANELAVPGCEQKLYSHLKMIENQLGEQAFDVFMELYELTKPNGNQNGAVTNVLVQKGRDIRVIYPFLRHDVRNILRQHPVAVFVADLDDLWYPPCHQRTLRRFR